jgi:hypothetical protein
MDAERHLRQDGGFEDPLPRQKRYPPTLEVEAAQQQVPRQLSPAPARLLSQKRERRDPNACVHLEHEWLVRVR